MVRIRRHGDRHGGGYTGTESRSALFRQGRREGDRLRGVLLSEVRDGHAWVKVDGSRLLARLEVPAVPGESLEFILVRLYPEIVLQAVRSQGGQDTSDSEIIARYRAARDIFFGHLHETVFDAVGHMASETPLASSATRHDAFVDALTAAPSAMYAFRDVCAALAPVRHVLAQRANGHMWLAPWRVAGADWAEFFCFGHGGSADKTGAGKEDLARVLVAARFSRRVAGQVLVDMRMAAGVASFRVYAEHPMAWIEPEAAGAMGGGLCSAHCLGVERLRFLPGDIPAFLLADTPGPYHGLHVRA